jgi:hypothetical protein
LLVLLFLSGFLGTFLPSARTSDRPMAMARLWLFTLPPGPRVPWIFLAAARARKK